MSKINDCLALSYYNKNILNPRRFSVYVKRKPAFAFKPTTAISFNSFENTITYNEQKYEIALRALKRRDKWLQGKNYLSYTNDAFYDDMGFEGRMCEKLNDELENLKDLKIVAKNLKSQIANNSPLKQLEKFGLPNISKPKTTKANEKRVETSNPKAYRICNDAGYREIRLINTKRRERKFKCVNYSLRV